MIITAPDSANRERNYLSSHTVIEANDVLHDSFFSRVMQITLL